MTCAPLITLTRNAAAHDDTPMVYDASAPSAATDHPWHQRDWFGPWQFELSATGSGGFNNTGVIYGGGLGLSLRHVSEFHAKPIIGLDEPYGVPFAVMTIGITAIPRGVWMGNEWGFDVRVRGLESHSGNFPTRQRLTLSIAPSFRISRPGSLLRFQALIPTFLPEVGIGLSQHRAPEVLVQFHPFSLGFVLSDHVTIELETTALIAVPTDKTKVEGAFLQSLSIALR